jgi:hypothetical protein
MQQQGRRAASSECGCQFAAVVVWIKLACLGDLITEEDPAGLVSAGCHSACSCGLAVFAKGVSGLQSRGCLKPGQAEDNLVKAATRQEQWS